VTFGSRISALLQDREHRPGLSMTRGRKRARGRKGGPKPKLTGRRLQLARQLYDQQRLTVTEIAETLGVGRATVYRALSRPA
jgi:DNA invertase Pin-like site-specific DNA recombinase